MHKYTQTYSYLGYKYTKNSICLSSCLICCISCTRHYFPLNIKKEKNCNVMLKKARLICENTLLASFLLSTLQVIKMFHPLLCCTFIEVPWELESHSLDNIKHHPEMTVPAGKALCSSSPFCHYNKLCRTK